jgi:hypothetical protein
MGVQLKLLRKERDKRCELDSHTTGGVPLGWISITWQMETWGSKKMHRISLPSVCLSASQEQQTGQCRHVDCTSVS